MLEEREHPYFRIELPERDLHEAEGITHDEATRQILGLERKIHEDPFAVQHLLTALSAVANAGTLRLERPVEAPDGTDPSISSMVTDYFRQRLDSHVDFDPQTEKAIANDTQHAHTVGQARGAVRYRVSVTGGDMSHAMRTPRDAELRRDTARVSRLAGYVRQVIEWREQHEDGVA